MFSLNRLILSPSEIRYSQNSIRGTFSCGKDLDETVEHLLKGEITVDDIPKIGVAEKDGKYYSMDNRRLWVFKEYERRCGTRVKVVCIRKSMNSSKFTTTNDGTSIFKK